MSPVLTQPAAAPRPSSLLYAPIARDLEAVERIYAATVANDRPAIQRLLHHLDHYRGKRLRPVLLLLTARACELIGEATNRVCEGELYQTLERGNLHLTEAEYFDIIDGKTAALTACCCRLGALYADAEPEVVDRLANYGRRLGLAFQVAD